jgi:hypothetical protein
MLIAGCTSKPDCLCTEPAAGVLLMYGNSGMGTAYVRAAAVWVLLRADYRGIGAASADYSGVGTATHGLLRCGYAYLQITAAWVMLRADYSGLGAATQTT